MALRIRAYQPTISEFLMLRAKKMGINDLLREFGIF
jgi:hypothetical protein